MYMVHLRVFSFSAIFYPFAAFYPFQRILNWDSPQLNLFYCIYLLYVIHRNYYPLLNTVILMKAGTWLICLWVILKSQVFVEWINEWVNAALFSVVTSKANANAYLHSYVCLCTLNLKARICISCMFRKYSHLYSSPPDEQKLKRKMNNWLSKVAWVPKLCLQFHLLFCRAIPPLLIIKRFITVKMTTDSKLRYNLSVKVILLPLSFYLKMCFIVFVLF